MKKSLTLVIALLLLLPLLAACGGNGDDGKASVTTPTDTTDNITSPDTSDITPPDTASPVTDAPVTASPVTDAPVTTAPVTTAAPSEKTELAVKWLFGYVGSSSHSSYAYKINPTGGMYSYTEVITLEKAGTEISFTDDNTNSGGDANFASASAFVISSWKQEGGAWVIDKDGVNIAGSGSAASLIATPGTGSVTYRYVTSKDNENIRLTYRSGESTSFKPSAYPTVYIRTNAGPGTADALGNADKEYDEWIEASKKTSYQNILEGITMNVIGDSYLAGDSLDTKYVWCSLLAEKYGMKYSNNGKNGSTVSNFVTTNNPMVSRWAAAAVGSPDIIIFEGGKNDYNKNVPIGTNDDTVTTTFKGSVKFMLDKLKAKCPDALIICVTVWNVSGTNSLGNKVNDYGKAMTEICELYDVPCFNATDTAMCGVDMTDAAFRAKYCQTPSDVSHLNIAGHRMVLPVFEKFITEQYARFLAKTATPAKK